METADGSSGPVIGDDFPDAIADPATAGGALASAAGAPISTPEPAAIGIGACRWHAGATARIVAELRAIVRGDFAPVDLM